MTDIPEAYCFIVCPICETTFDDIVDYEPHYESEHVIPVEVEEPFNPHKELELVITSGNDETRLLYYWYRDSLYLLQNENDPVKLGEIYEVTRGWSVRNIRDRIGAHKTYKGNAANWLWNSITKPILKGLGL